MRYNYLRIIVILLLSLIITDCVKIIAINTDIIMKKINSDYYAYEKKGKNATINENEIIPGVCDKKVNKSKSYKQMKKIGIYNDNYYKFEYRLPKINILNNLDKVIISDNDSNNIYLFVDYKDDMNIKNYNIILNYNNYVNNKNKIISLMKNNSIILVDTNFKNYKKINKVYNAIKKQNINCLYTNKEFLMMCSKNGSITIKIKNQVDYNLLLNIKKFTKRGSFIYINNDNYYKYMEYVERILKNKGLVVNQIDKNILEC